MGSKQGTRTAKNPLLESLKHEPDEPPPSQRTWFGRMSTQDPEAYANLVEIAQDFRRGGEAAKKLHTVTNLHNWLIKNNAFTTRVGIQSFRRWMWELESDG